MPIHEGEVLAQGEIRRRNLSRLLRALHLVGPLSRSELASRLAVNRSTVGSLVTELAGLGLVRQRSAVATAGPGRPSPVIEPAADGPVVLAAEIATDSLAVAVVGVGGSILGERRVERPRDLRPPEALVADVAALARPLLRQLRSGQLLVGTGVAVPGLVRHEDGIVHRAPNLGWSEVPLAGLIRAAFAPEGPIHVGNDADLAALAEYLRGSGVGTHDFICLWGEAGIGAGVVVAGRSLTGSAGYTGEVGHLTVNAEGHRCRCGSRGCWETEIGEEALLRHAARASRSGARGVEEVLVAAEGGLPWAREAVDSVGRWLGIGLAGLVDIFNPERIALGGLYGRLLPLVAGVVDAELDTRCMAAPRGLVEIVPVRLGTQSALLGAAELALAPLLDDPSSMSVERLTVSAA